MLALLVAAGPGCGERPEGRYQPEAEPARIQRWNADYTAKRDLLPALPAPVPISGSGPGPGPGPRRGRFDGRFRFGRYDYELSMRQEGDLVRFVSGGVDRQRNGGAFQTRGLGVVRDGRLFARWWCFDLTRNVANNGGCEIWFDEDDPDLLRAAYYHDSDRRIEEGYGVRLGTHPGERLHYRIRQPHPVAEGVTLSGSVRGRGGEVIADAVVLVRGDDGSAVRSDEGGRWDLTVAELPTVLMLSAGAPGYRNSVEAILHHRLRRIDFVLEPSPHGDDASYEFLPPDPDPGEAIWNCGNCHRNSYDEWKQSRHALTASNLVTRAVYERDFLPALLAGTATVDDPNLCSACHAPQAAPARLGEVEGVALRGNHCDFCHKVHHTDRLDRPGVRGSLALSRPSPDDRSVPGPIKRVYGSLADVDYIFMGAVYSPFFATSALCAGCHQYRTRNRLPALDTYDEWRRWAATRPKVQSCQSCHMPTGSSMEGKRLAKRICVNGLRRPNKEQIHDHSFYGRELLTDALRMTSKARIEQGAIVVETRVWATEVGHKVPTGSGDKHLLLVVVALDSDGKALKLRSGPRLPAHAGGTGDPFALDGKAMEARLDRGDFAGIGGREFAQVLADKAGRTHVPFWRAVRLVEDTRLVPDEPITVRHRFDLGPRNVAEVRVELVHRLRFKSHDVARDVRGAGVRPLDQLVLEKTHLLR